MLVRTSGKYSKTPDQASSTCWYHNCTHKDADGKFFISMPVAGPF